MGQITCFNCFSDPIPSAGGSDDEGSNAATDGSTLRTSPAEQAGSGGSESGGSGVESIGGTSGRSSTYGDQPNQSPPRDNQASQPQPSTSQQPGPSKPQAGPSSSSTAVAVDSMIEKEPTGAQTEADETAENESVHKLHVLRCSILEKMIDKVDKLDGVGGVQAIPFMQVVHLLTMDLDGSQELGQRVMNKLLTVFIKKLEMVSSTPASQV